MDGRISELTKTKGIPTDNSKTIEIRSDRSLADDQKFIPEPFKAVARGMEEQFAELMLNEMNKTVEQSSVGAGDEAGMDFYKSLQKSEQAKLISAKDILGLQKIILDQIYPKSMRNKVALDHYHKQNDRQRHHILPSYNIGEKIDTIKKGEEQSSR